MRCVLNLPPKGRIDAAQAIIFDGQQFGIVRFFRRGAPLGAYFRHVIA
jgi:hypothetical protein